jgi:uncharacterized protein YbjT (DUF2867 family)
MAAIHAELDRLVVGSGIPSTIVRPGMFAANSIMWWASQIQAGDVVRWPYGPVETAPIDERDIAAVAVRALVEAYVTSTVANVTGTPARTFGEWAAANAGSFLAPTRSHQR